MLFSEKLRRSFLLKYQVKSALVLESDKSYFNDILEMCISSCILKATLLDHSRFLRVFIFKEVSRY